MIAGSEEKEAKGHATKRFSTSLFGDIEAQEMEDERMDERKQDGKNEGKMDGGNSLKEGMDGRMNGSVKPINHLPLIPLTSFASTRIPPEKVFPCFGAHVNGAFSGFSTTKAKIPSAGAQFAAVPPPGMTWSLWKVTSGVFREDLSSF